MLEIVLPHDQRSYKPEEVVSLQVRWSCETPTPIEALELRLVWNTAGKGDQDLHVVSRYRQENPQPTGEDRIELTLPAGPYSFSGKLISLIWAFEFLAFPQEDSCREEFILAPQGQEVLLTSGKE